MHKLSQNLGKISKNQPKLVVGRFFCGQNIGLVRRVGEEKRVDSNNIHLQGKARTLKPHTSLVSYIHEVI